VSEFDSYAIPITGPATSSFAVTPSDNDDLPQKVRMVTLSGEGVLTYHNWRGDTCTTNSLPSGSYPMFAQRILATGTTATGLTGWT